eukprot:CAMPEP_0184113304 /NCGR_PEP_ID=MMETSP0974-20121125/18851_1 /TAXON_ID=483370 /ORGANISM="non described non described, Strain CCMP2097" /LENGTH=42 /DNA_ID= /DNA_START= /DNA_END= /DNA_ORIENTATION=
MAADDKDPASVECDSSTPASCRLHVRSRRERVRREVEDLCRV